MTSNKIAAKRVVQNGQEFLLGTFKMRQVSDFTKYTKHIIVDYEEVGSDDRIYSEQRQIKPRYNEQIQRKTSKAKVQGIVDFLLNSDMAMFPTNIVISIPSGVIDDFEELGDNEILITLNPIVKRELEKENGDVLLTIIDGQHRIKGIERAIEVLKKDISDLSKVIILSRDSKKLEEKRISKQTLLDNLLNFELIVTFFIDPTLEYQAMIFATINKTQTKVPENLVYSLFGLTKNDSPQKTSLEVVLALNGIGESPFFNRVKLVGGNYKRGMKVPLSQATMVKSILFNISNNARESEIDRFKKRTDLKSNTKNLLFRKYYVNNNDKEIVRIMYAYFSAIRETFVDSDGNPYWLLSDINNITNILQTNVGYQAMLKVLFRIVEHLDKYQYVQKDAYKQYLEKAKSLDFEDIGEEKRYPFTSKSINILYEDVMSKIGIT